MSESESEPQAEAQCQSDSETEPAAAYRRFVALGDSFTEGVGDPDPARPNGLRGWADRVAEVLAGRDPDFRYANLAVRGRKMQAILDEQVNAAIALKPDLISVYAGANDVMRPKVDIDGIVEGYDAAVGRLAGTGARVLVFAAFDPGTDTMFRFLRGRFATYNELVRELADRHGATLVDSWRMPSGDPALWAEDRLHLGPRGHQLVAIEVLRTLGVPHRLSPLPPPPADTRTAAERRRDSLTWTRTHLLPWVQRRITGRSSGDEVAAKRPSLDPIRAV